MKTIRLTYNQEMKLWHGEAVRIKRHGIVAYVSEEDGELVARTWTGTVWDDVKIVSELFDRNEEKNT